jgi:hypothetical protein
MRESCSQTRSLDSSDTDDSHGPRGTTQASQTYASFQTKLFKKNSNSLMGVTQSHGLKHGPLVEEPMFTSAAQTSSHSTHHCPPGPSFGTTITAESNVWKEMRCPAHRARLWSFHCQVMGNLPYKLSFLELPVHNTQQWIKLSFLTTLRPNAWQSHHSPWSSVWF